MLCISNYIICDVTLQLFSKSSNLTFFTRWLYIFKINMLSIKGDKSKIRYYLISAPRRRE